jgi:hypothetical protein
MKKILFLTVIAALSFSCKNANEEARIEDARQATIDSMKAEREREEMALAKQRTIDSMNRVAAAREERTRTVVVNNTPAEQKRKGWSGAAKGAAIGAGVGAVTGAVVSKKNPAAGAVIGGLAGAGVGAGTGAIIDSEKKKKEEQKK